MSLIDIIRRPNVAKLAPEIAEGVLEVVGSIVERARDLAAARQRLARAARRGDLDFLLTSVRADKDRAQRFIDNG